MTGPKILTISSQESSEEINNTTMKFQLNSVLSRELPITWGVSYLRVVEKQQAQNL